MSKARAVVLGAGFAGLETLFYLRHRLQDRVDLTLVSEQDHFLFKPNTIYVPFGADPGKLKVGLRRPAERKNIRLVLERAQAIDADRKLVATGSQEIPYDYLVVATGAAMRAEEIPGLAQHALTLWTVQEMLDLRGALGRLVEEVRDGSRRRLVFLVPPNNKCSGPLYEMSLMVDTWLRRRRVRDRVTLAWATYEERYIQAFGPRLHDVVAEEFMDRGVEGYRGVRVTEVQPRRVLFQNGLSLDYDLLVSFPPYVARERFEALPVDDRGFVRVEPDSRRVLGRESVFAVGDAADFPIKQAYLALLQGDAAGEHVAAQIAGRPPDPGMRFEPMSLCVMEELDKATFAQVPLKYTDDPERPVAVDVEDSGNYRVGVSPLWRAGKKLLGLYLPWRFGSGEPFHAGFAWGVMELGLKAMSTVLAD